MAIVDGKEVDVEKELTQESRDDVYTRFRQEHGGPLPVEEEKEEKEAKEEKETPSEVPVETEQPLPEEEAGKEVKEEKKTKTVPYDALHEERVKRKAASEAQRAAEERARRLEAQIDQLKKSEPETDISDYDAELRDAKRRLQAIEEVEQRRTEEDAERRRDEAHNKFESTMKKIDKELREEGYGGFAYAKNAVAEEIAKLVQDEELIDTEEDWKRVFKESIYPNLSAAVKEADQKRALQFKMDAKSQAGLATMSGKMPAKPKSADDMTPEEARDDYIKNRYKNVP